VERRTNPVSGGRLTPGGGGMRGRPTRRRHSLTPGGGGAARGCLGGPQNHGRHHTEGE
jgi:hypothetical protein